ncbi:hypothetical protein [Sphingomonas sp. ERG5]|uniref:hypothetical protein n=1 Tax=Sphingomonas sp. ERG5 TaxID=1381597 RepID=UPI00054B0639|nr:hypothetical protein [Sphingomonas sp. ERG5]
MFGVERPHWHPLPAVAQAIATGEPWLLAWALQSAIPYRLLAQKSGISDARLDELYRGAPVSRAELAALAATWKIEVEQVMLTLPAGALAE